MKLLLCLLIIVNVAFGQQVAGRPKLAVVIVVDQMRADFIDRYWDRFGKDGFRRLVSQGYSFRNARFNYVPTYTGPGHASIFTGATPATHGIIANEWHVRGTNKTSYCVQDTSTTLSNGQKPGSSAGKLLCTTIGDELKLSTGGKGKVFAVAMKDRSAVLPAGHAADGAYWLDESTGRMQSSSWYPALPQWLESFNRESRAKAMLASGWKPLYPSNTYTSSLADDNRYESASNKKPQPVFPYEFNSSISSGNYGILKATPFGNSLTAQVAQACVEGAQLGRDAFPDLLCVSFSSTDYIEHSYGPRAMETEDAYLRLDLDIAALLKTLDAAAPGAYVVALTADHGGADVPTYLADRKIPSGFVYEKNVASFLKSFAQAKWGDSTLVEDVSNSQVYLDAAKWESLPDAAARKELLVAQLVGLEGIDHVFLRSQVVTACGDGSTLSLVRNGFNQRLSGDICYTLRSGYMDYGPTGTTHGSGFSYDTNVPVIFFGSGVRKGVSYRYTPITAIAPTLAALLGTAFPSGANEEPLQEIMK